MAERPLLRIVVVYSPAPREVDERQITVPDGATVKDALLASGMLVAYSALQADQPDVGIWGRRARLAQAVVEGDRIEIYRSLRVDPKVARRERFRGQGARNAGLFAQRRPGAKQGY